MLVDVNLDLVGRVLEHIEFLLQIGAVARRECEHVHAVDGLGQTEVAVLQNAVVGIDQQHRNRVIALDDAEHEVHIVHGHGHHVAVLVVKGFVGHGGEFLGSVGPNLHAFTLLLRKIFHQTVRNQEKHGCENEGDSNEGYLPDASRVVDVSQIHIERFKCNNAKYSGLLF